MGLSKLREIINRSLNKRIRNLEVVIAAQKQTIRNQGAGNEEKHNILCGIKEEIDEYFGQEKQITGLEAALKSILEGSVKMPPYDDGKSPESIGFFGDLHLDKPENAYHFGFETALLECGEIIAKAMKENQNDQS